MSKGWRGGRFVLLFFVVAALVTGCVPATTADAGWTTLTVAGTRLYSVRSTGEAVALDLTDGGSLLWRYPQEQASAAPGCGIAQSQGSNSEAVVTLGGVYGTPAVSDGLMLVGSTDRKLVALEADTGDPAWSFPVDGAIIGGVAVADGVAYFGTATGSVYAVQLADQQVAWAPFATGDRVWSTPHVSDGRLYVASMDHNVYALDRTSGELIWSADLRGAIQGDITLAQDVLFAGGVDRRLHAIDADTGRELWATAPLDGWVWGAPLRSELGVYFTTLNGQLHGYDPESGEPLWNPVTLNGAITAGPVMAGESILVGTDQGLVYVVDPADSSAEVLYGSSTDQQRGGFLSAPAAHEGIVYLGTTMGYVVALDPAERTPELWVYPSGEEG